MQPIPLPESSPPALVAARRDLQLALDAAIEAMPHFAPLWAAVAETGDTAGLPQIQPGHSEEDEFQHHKTILRQHFRRLHRLEKTRLAAAFPVRQTPGDPTRLTIEAGALRLMLATVRAASPPKVPWSESASRMHEAARDAMAQSLSELDDQLTHLLGLDRPAAAP
jgi:hypothetical protein